MICVRFAPSPTGWLHVGGVRTALFNFLYARRQQGKFLLRIEDTDRERSKPEFEKEILDSLKWLGLDWDGDIIRQSERLKRYREVAQDLLSKKLAYESKGAIKFKIPQTQVKVFDLVRGEIAYNSKEFDDLVIMKSDGFPTFHLAVVVDDHDMAVTHVIRGEDHLSNTPRHILLIQALGWKPPKYAHLPLIFAPDGAPLSKRHGAVSVTEYRERGYLPEGLLNYLALLGWSSGTNQEILTLKDLIKQFSLKRVITSNAKFDSEKLLWVNGQHIRKLPETDYETQMTEFWKKQIKLPVEKKWQKLIGLYRTRIETFQALKDQASFYFSEVEYQDKKTLGEIRGNKNLIQLLKKWQESVKGLSDFEDIKVLDQKTRELAGQAGLQPKDLIHPLRFILTGKTATPGLFEVISLLGKETCLSRLKKFL